MKHRVISSVLCAAVLSVGAVAVPTVTSANEPEPPSQTEIIRVLEQSVQIKPISATGNAPVIVIQDADGRIITPAMESPNFSAGLGWSIYLYFSRSNWSYLQGLGYTALSAAVCAWLVATIAGAIGCAVVAYIIYDLVGKYGLPPVGYCREVKISYSGNLQGVKNVKRSC